MDYFCIQGVSLLFIASFSIILNKSCLAKNVFSIASEFKSDKLLVSNFDVLKIFSLVLNRRTVQTLIFRGNCKNNLFCSYQKYNSHMFSIKK